MSDEKILSYAGNVERTKPALTPAQKRRIRIVLCITLTVVLLVFGALYAVCVGDTRLRVRVHHGIRLPPSAWISNCRGSTLFALDGRSKADITLDAEHLSAFLSQFEEYQFVNGTDSSGGYKSAGTPEATPEGDVFGPSPTGRDWYMLDWKTVGGRVHAHIETDWN